jgi:hypothetical protein
VRYLERTRNTDPIYQHVILATYARNVLTPHAAATTNFVNKFLDDTAWWGLAWLEAAKYELRYRHDLNYAGTFLRLAEWDATKIADAPKRCGGVEWRLGYPPDTIANSEYAALAGGLYDFRNRPGVFADAQLAAYWLSEARSTLKWLVDSKLVDMRTGIVADTMAGSCRRPLKGPITYTEGQVAEALTQLGMATGDRTYFRQAARFLTYATSRFTELTNGVLSEPCESRRGRCETHRKKPWDVAAYKGVLMQAVDDWSTATGSSAYRGFVLAQSAAILQNDASDGGVQPGACATPHTCQFGLYWASRVAPGASVIGVTVGTQTSALDVLTAALTTTSARAPGRFRPSGRARPGRAVHRPKA